MQRYRAIFGIPTTTQLLGRIAARRLCLLPCRLRFTSPDATGEYVLQRRVSGTYSVETTRQESCDEELKTTRAPEHGSPRPAVVLISSLGGELLLSIELLREQRQCRPRNANVSVKYHEWGVFGPRGRRQLQRPLLGQDVHTYHG